MSGPQRVTTIASVAIAAGSSTASFKYVDTLASTPTLTAAATGLTSATQVETVNSAVTLTPGPSAMIVAASLLGFSSRNAAEITRALVNSIRPESP